MSTGGEKKPHKITAKDICIMGLMVAVIEVCKQALLFLPNIELTSFWIIMFTLFFGWRILFVIPAFILIEMCLYGPQLWVIMYLYVWPLLALLAHLFRKDDRPLFWAVLSGFFGLSFGFLCSFPYFFTGAVGNTVRSGLYAMFTWWVAGIPYDLVHCAGNFGLMLVLYTPIKKVMLRVQKEM